MRWRHFPMGMSLPYTASVLASPYWRATRPAAVAPPTGRGGRHWQWTDTSGTLWRYRTWVRRDRANGSTRCSRFSSSLLVSFTRMHTQPKARCERQPPCCDSSVVPRPRAQFPTDAGDCSPGRRARCVTILIAISWVRYASRIYARWFGAAKRTSPAPSSAPSGSHRTLSSYNVAWNWPLNTCLRPMRP
jgi:hypothetical protein